MDEMKTTSIERCIELCVPYDKPLGTDKLTNTATAELSALKERIAELEKTLSIMDEKVEGYEAIQKIFEQQLRDAERKGYELASSQMYDNCDEPKCQYMTYAEARAEQEDKK